MKLIAMLTFATLAATVATPAASANLTTICTPPTPPVGACIYLTITSTNVYYWDPNVGPGYHYTCDPYGLVCVLTPDVTYTYRYVTIPWVSTSGTYVWCDICKDIETGASPLLP